MDSWIKGWALSRTEVVVTLSVLAVVAAAILAISTWSLRERVLRRAVVTARTAVSAGIRYLRHRPGHAAH